MSEARQKPSGPSCIADGCTEGYDAAMCADKACLVADFRDLALKVSNDISEDIDGGENREELREVVRWWAQKACDEAQRRATAEQTVKMVRLAKELMDVALPNVKVEAER